MAKKQTGIKCKGVPEAGDIFTCGCCGMRVLVVRDCWCNDEDCKPCFKCCGEEMCED